RPAFREVIPMRAFNPRTASLAVLLVVPIAFACLGQEKQPGKPTGQANRASQPGKPTGQANRASQPGKPTGQANRASQPGKPTAHRVAMSDGVRLATDVYLPGDGTGKYRVVAARTPYDKTRSTFLLRAE